MLAKMLTAVLLAFSLFPSAAFALDPVTRIADQPDCPIKIVSYRSEFQMGEGQYYSRDFQGVYHLLEYTNASQKEIVAFQLTFLCFDIWNESMSTNYGYSYRSTLTGMEANAFEALGLGAGGNRVWITRLDRPHLYLTGMVGVTKVRFEDGTIWKSEIKDWAGQLEDLIPGIDEMLDPPSEYPTIPPVGVESVEEAEVVEPEEPKEAE